MKFKDHKNISFYLVKSQERRIKARNKWALVVGSVIPDIAVYTYLRGSLGGEKLKGHNYENTCDIISNLIEYISNSQKYGMRRFFALGKLLHYSADSFTYAHNSRFKGTISEHRAYEMELHEKLVEAMDGEEAERFEVKAAAHREDVCANAECGGRKGACNRQAECVKAEVSGDEMCEKIRRLHDAYAAKTPDSENDCSYIMYVLDYLYTTLATDGAAERKHAA